MYNMNLCLYKNDNYEKHLGLNNYQYQIEESIINKSYKNLYKHHMNVSDSKIITTLRLLFVYTTCWYAYILYIKVTFTYFDNIYAP